MLYNGYAFAGDAVFPQYPGVAQLVARVVWDHDAAGSNPVTRTMKETSFVYQDKRGFFLHFGQILSKYGQIGDWIGLRSSFAAASEPDFCVFGAR